MAAPEHEAPAVAVPEPGSSAVQLGLLFSAIRCVLTYAVIPGLAIASGVRDSTERLAVGLQVLGAVVAIYGTVRLWQARSRWRWAYTAVAALVVLLAVIDLRSL